MKIMSIFLNEVYQQPEAIKKLLNKKEDILLKAENIPNKNILFAGMGASYFAANYISDILKDYGFNAWSIELSRLLDFEKKDFLKNFDSIILISQSGESIELIKFVNEYSGYIKKSFLITNNPSSPILGQFLEKQLIFINAGEENSMGSTKTFTNTLVTLLIIVQKWIEKDLKLENLVKSYEKMLNFDINNLLDFFLDNKNFPIFISWKWGVSILNMISLTLTEVSKIPSLVFEGATFRHGIIEILAVDPLIILLPISDDITYKKFKNLKRDLQQLKAKIFTLESLFENVNTLSKETQPIPYLVIFQKLANFLAIGKELEPGQGIYASKVTKKE